jgi:hypothetical protein
MTAHRKIFASRPSALRFMPKAVWPKPSWRPAQGFPTSTFVWQDYAIPSDTIAMLQGFAGSHEPACREALLLLAPHITGLPLSMALLTHPRWPIPIWKALQFRNRLRLVGSLQTDRPGELRVKASGWRVHDKGLEVDLHAQYLQDGAPVWESIVAYYYRGRFGPSFEHGDALGAPAMSPVLDPSTAPAAQWTVDNGRRLEFCRLTGDYNPLHLTTHYAHRMGFAAAFPHPQRVAAQCLGHLAATGAPPRELDLWIKGPAFFGSAVTLRQKSTDDGGQNFGLWVEGEERPALVGSLRSEASPAVSSA